MAIRRWKELVAKLPAERRTRIDEKAAQILIELDLAEMRKLLGMTQAELAARLETTQSQVSQTEARDDHRLSTLRRYVEALGGQLEVVARFGDKSIKLHAA